MAKDYFQLPRSLIREDFLREKDMAFLIYYLICRADDNGRIEVSFKEIHKLSGLSRQRYRTLIQQIKEIAESTTEITTESTANSTTLIISKSASKIKTTTTESTTEITTESTAKKESKKEGFERFRQYFNSVMGQANLPQIRELSARRQKMLLSIFNEYGRDVVEEVLGKVIKSEYLTVKWGKVNFNWIFNRENFLKILEGTYDNRPNQTQQYQSSGRGQYRTPDALDLAREILGESAS